MARSFSNREAEQIGNAIGVDWSVIPLDEYRVGLGVERSTAPTIRRRT